MTGERKKERKKESSMWGIQQKKERKENRNKQTIKIYKKNVGKTLDRN